MYHGSIGKVVPESTKGNLPSLYDQDVDEKGLPQTAVSYDAVCGHKGCLYVHLWKLSASLGMNSTRANEGSLC